MIGLEPAGLMPEFLGRQPVPSMPWLLPFSLSHASSCNGLNNVLKEKKNMFMPSSLESEKVTLVM